MCGSFFFFSFLATRHSTHSASAELQYIHLGPYPTVMCRSFIGHAAAARCNAAGYIYLSRASALISLPLHLGRCNTRSLRASQLVNSPWFTCYIAHLNGELSLIVLYCTLNRQLSVIHVLYCTSQSSMLRDSRAILHVSIVNFPWFTCYIAHCSPRSNK